MHTVSVKGLASPSFQYLMLALVIITGVVIGATLANRAGLGKESGFHIFMQQTLSKETASKGFWALFSSSFFASAILLCAAFLLGLCVLGAPGHIGISLFKGAGIGLSMGFIYIEYGLKGLGICALFILPWAVLTSLAVMVSCREGIRFSFRLAAAVLPSAGQIRLWEGFCDYCLRYVFCFVLVLIAAAIQALSAIAFSGLFFS